ncbi:FkbM family methyltransferase [Comamonas testosteroni]|uniref:FkbM family methyltransferase n=1 Tax=Comamonas testosteroni TaxID=285 RepID=UPI00068F8741|nr:FkbM family methyltransferase [Comamonas testosteroni]
MDDAQIFMCQGVGVCRIGDKDVRYLLSNKNSNAWRFETLFTKEPETLEWIDSFSEGDVLWDVGANIGMYSIYAALRGINVVAFEPHFGNYFQLCANIYMNGLQDKIKAYCFALSEDISAGTINLASISIGTALSSFNNDLDYLGNPYIPAFRQGMMGCSIDQLVKLFGMDVPNHLKIDVDGIELDIVKGARQTLSDPKLKSVSIELVEMLLEQVDGVNSIMHTCGLEFMHKKQSTIYPHKQLEGVLNFLYKKP